MFVRVDSVSPFIFNFPIGMVMEIVLPSCEIGKINICSLRNFLDLEYVIDFVPLCEEPGKLHVLAIA